ncbi:MAG: SDR family NAD(P)-dependent oxidoreductase [Methylococcales bacterium]|nr:SDR family NAD(P)-dependent oxidoreductase [Methylococcales bacterium]
MNSLGAQYKALVIGSSGAIGAAFLTAFKKDPNCSLVVGLSRTTMPGFSLESEASISDSANLLALNAPFHLIVDATGALIIDGQGPEKQLARLDPLQLSRAFEINTIGPSLLIKHFVPLLDTDNRAIYAKLSARVGSISDNKKGGWYGYRSSKAALNMILQTAAIECSRSNPTLVFAALQPGTVASKLSAKFVSPEHCLPADEAVQGLMQALDDLVAKSGAYFIDYQGQAIDW